MGYDAAFQQEYRLKIAIRNKCRKLQLHKQCMIHGREAILAQMNHVLRAAQVWLQLAAACCSKTVQVLHRHHLLIAIQQDTSC